MAAMYNVRDYLSPDSSEATGDALGSEAGGFVKLQKAKAGDISQYGH